MKIIDLPQQSPAWLAWRSDGVGASDLPAILGISPHKDATRDLVFGDKVTRTIREGNYAMKRGNFLEPEARAEYQRRRPCEVYVCCGEHEEYPWARASFDGFCSRAAAKWLLELKCQNQEIHAEILATHEVPHHHIPQVQWQLFVSGYERLDYASYSKARRFAESERMAIVPVFRDEALIAALLDEAAQFWMSVLDQRGA